MIQVSRWVSSVSRFALLAAVALLVLGLAGAPVQARVAPGPVPPGPQISTSVPSTGSPLSPPVAPQVVLYDQYNNPASFDITSQDFEAALDTADDQAADDFVIPAGQTWSIEGVDVDGEYMGTGPAASFHVHFYADASTLPGALVCDRPANPYTNGPSAGDAAITLISPCVLFGPGTYWVSVQSRQDFNPAGQWFWQNRSAQSGFPAAWQNPGDGFGTGCVTWQVRTLCLPSILGPDQVYRLNGVVVPVDLQDFTVED
jgi:hypothetical protein